MIKFFIYFLRSTDSSFFFITSDREEDILLHMLFMNFYTLPCLFSAGLVSDLSVFSRLLN
jgi:hypothetical protein